MYNNAVLFINIALEFKNDLIIFFISYVCICTHIWHDVPVRGLVDPGDITQIPKKLSTQMTLLEDTAFQDGTLLYFVVDIVKVVI